MDVYWPWCLGQEAELVEVVEDCVDEEAAENLPTENRAPLLPPGGEIHVVVSEEHNGGDCSNSAFRCAGRYEIYVLVV